MVANKDNWMIVENFVTYVWKTEKEEDKRGQTADQTLFKYILETSGSDKLSLCVYNCISQRREKWSKAHISLYVYFVQSFFPRFWIVTNNRWFVVGGPRYYLQSTISNVNKKCVRRVLAFKHDRRFISAPPLLPHPSFVTFKRGMCPYLFVFLLKSKPLLISTLCNIIYQRPVDVFECFTLTACRDKTEN